jgi:RNA ligase
MSKFPIITHLTPFKEAVGDKPEIKHMVQSNGMTVSSYVVSMESTWDNAHAIECRGLVFDQQERLVARPLHKFFNLNEKDGARPHDFNWSKLARVMDKRDGSMIHTVKVDCRVAPFSSQEIKDGMPIDQDTMSCGARISNFTLKSKKSFESDVAVQARAWMTTRKNYIDFCEAIIEQDCTAIFEWTSPTARIVLPYQEDLLTLLHVRDNQTGQYWPMGRLDLNAHMYGVPIVESEGSKSHQRDYTDSMFAKMLGEKRDPAHVLRCVLELQETITDIEGWVFQFEDGQMVKVKTKWYMERHRAMTNMRERDIVKMVLLEEIDDLKAMLVGEGVDVTEIAAIEQHTVEELLAIERVLDAYVLKAQGMDFKEAALTFGPKGEDFEYFALLMAKLRGKEPNLKEHYTQHVLPSISLRQVELTQSVAEAE